MTLPTAKAISPANAFLARAALTRWDPTLGVIPWTDTSGTVGIYSDVAGTTPLPGLEPAAISEAPGGVYYYAFAGDDVTTGLDGLADGTLVYQILIAGDADELRVVQPLRVTIPRYAGA